MNLHSRYVDAYRTTPDLMYPAGTVIRIFKGNYLELSLPKADYEQSSILDVGCNDDRRLVFLSGNLGFDAYGVEPTDELVKVVASNVSEASGNAEVHSGTNRYLPFREQVFEYLLSWNSCYYIEEEHQFDFPGHVREYARVVRDGGRIFFSIPKASSFNNEDAEPIGDGYRINKNAWYGTRDGAVLRRFGDLGEIIDAFSMQFENFTTASTHNDFFGYNYHWLLLLGALTSEP